MIRLWHGVLAVVIAVATVGQTVVSANDDRSLVNMYSFFTVQSNLLMLLASVLIVIRPDRRGTGWGVLRIAGLVGITITGIVFATVLAGLSDLSGAEWWFDKMFHYVSPVMSVLGWLLFRPRTRFTWRQVGWFLIWPVAWLAYTLIRGEVVKPTFSRIDAEAGSHYPYPFLDVVQHGAGTVAVNCVVITLGFVVVSAVYVWLTGVFDRSKHSADAAVT